MLKKFRFRGSDVAGDISSRYGFTGELLTLFTEASDAEVHKWHHYIPIYDRYFGRFRSKPVRFLEIGVSRGGSLRIWRKFFGPEAVIFGIDIDPDCARHDGDYGTVRIGSQSDSGFLRSVVGEMGGLDVVLDDGSHVMSDIRRSLEVLFPMLDDGGIYMIEDLHAAYAARYEGGIHAPANFFNLLRELTDDMHRWYHGQPVGHAFARDLVTGLHVHDSIAVLEKGLVHAPVHSRIGSTRTAGGETHRGRGATTGTGLADDVVTVAEATVAFASAPGSRQTYGAVLDRDLEPVALSHSLDSGQIRTLQELCRSAAAPVERIAGTFAYGGDLSSHFGHQVVENSARAWVQDHLDGAIDGTLYYPRRIDLEAPARGRARKLLATLGVATPICIDAPVKVERLVVARPGWGVGPLMPGTLEMRRFLRSRHATSGSVAPGRKLYLTRRRQPLRRGHVLMEERFEELFRAAGFEIVEPEVLDFAAQLELYRNASCIVAVESSLFHAVAISAPADCVVAVLKRRSARMFGDICDSLEAFLGRDVLRMDDIRSRWVARSGRTPVEFLEISAGALWDKLTGSGIAIGTPRWEELSSDELDGFLDRLREGLPRLSALEPIAP